MMADESEHSAVVRCIFCGGSSQSAESGGSIISKDGISAHQYCLYFSSGLAQRGNEERGEGLSGFLPKDIHTEVRRSLPFKCSVCGEKGASIGCAVKRCRCMGHYSCLQSKDYLFQHFNNFETFCPKHRPNQMPVCVQQTECPICLMFINAEPGFSQIYCPHCKTYFHRSCVQRQGLSAGYYYMRCPVCNDKDHYIQEMLTMGIAVPEKDAEWELSGQFVEDIEATKYCHAENCHCPLGRSHHSSIGKYKMRKCVSCGQWIGHVRCLKGQPEQCSDCIAVPPQRSKLPPMPSPPSPPSTAPSSGSAQCKCVVCVAKSSLYLGDSCSENRSRAVSPNVSTKSDEHFTVSIPRRLVKLSHKPLAVSIPTKRLHDMQRKGLNVTVSRAHPQYLLGLENGIFNSKASVHPIMKALSRQYPRMKMLSFIRLPLYTPHQLLHQHKPRSCHSQTEKQIKSRQLLQSEMDNQTSPVQLRELQSRVENPSEPVQSRQLTQSVKQVELRQLSQSEMEDQSEPVELRRLSQSEMEDECELVESRQLYNSPLLQILYDYTIGDDSKN